MLGLAILVSAILLLPIWATVRRTGTLTPAVIFMGYSWVSLVCFLMVLGFGIDKYSVEVDGVYYSAMPMNGLSPALVTVLLFYSLLVILGWISSFGLKLPALSLAYELPRLRQHEEMLALFMLLILLCCSARHFWELDKAVVWSSTGYLGIKTPDVVGLHSAIGRSLHFLLRLVGFVASISCVYFFSKRYVLLGALSLSLAIYAGAIMLAANSRWVPLYFVGAGIFCQVSSGFRASFPLYVASLITFVAVIVGRGQESQGLAHVIENISIERLKDFDRQLLGIFINIFEGSLNFANSFLDAPDFDRKYKLLSFSPLPSAVDGFDSIRDELKYKFAIHVPMGGLGEAYNFGVAFCVLFLSGILIFLRVSTRLCLKFGGLVQAAAVAVSAYVTFAVHCYSIRTSWRYLVFLTVIGVLLLFVRLPYSRTRQSGLA